MHVALNLSFDSPLNKQTLNILQQFSELPICQAGTVLNSPDVKQSLYPLKSHLLIDLAMA